MSIPELAGPTPGLRLAPFRGLRYVSERVGSLSAVTSPPYDVVVRPDEVHALQSADPHNVVRLILPQNGEPAANHIQAARTLRRWREEGVLAPDPVPALYVYEQTGPQGDIQRGLIGALRLTTADEKVVLPHEEVMPAPVADRAGLMRATATNLEPLLLAYRGEEDDAAASAVDRAVQRPALLCTTTEDGVRHRLWAITDPAEIATIDASLAPRQALIADGHHRWATYLRLRDEQREPGPWNYGLVLLVDTTRFPLQVRAIHRVLQHLPVAEALRTVRSVFDVESVKGPLPEALDALDAAVTGSGSRNSYLLAGDGGFYLVTHPDNHQVDEAVPRDGPEAWRRLDTTVLHSLLIDRLWQVPDLPEHIGYVHDAPAAVRQAERLGGTAVLMRPVPEATVLHLARQGVMMPHKSTSFGPKPASGLVLRGLDLE
ncbi:MAG: DUF1015 domain-containing protein [Streptomycetaceae bacterium]|nr:DUF1015 domain-containing protein [Streptomycetaceae bacterium]